MVAAFKSPNTKNVILVLALIHSIYLVLKNQQSSYTSPFSYYCETAEPLFKSNFIASNYKLFTFF